MKLLQASELTARQTRELIARLGGVENARHILAGLASVQVTRLPIDTSIRKRFENFGVVDHVDNGILDWDPIAVDLQVFEDQGRMTGAQVWEKIQSFDPARILNGTVLEFYRINPKAIPPALAPDHDRGVAFYYFWGTIYRDSRSDKLLVRSLCRSHAGFEPRWRYLDTQWDDVSYAVLRRP